MDEEEQRFYINKEKFMFIENEKITFEKDNVELKEEARKLNIERDRYKRDADELKDQLRVMSQNMKRDKDFITSKLSENMSLEKETTTLRKLMEEVREQAGERRIEQTDIIKNLRMQLDETRAMVEQIND